MVMVIVLMVMTARFPQSSQITTRALAEKRQHKESAQQPCRGERERPILVRVRVFVVAHSEVNTEQRQQKIHRVAEAHRADDNRDRKEERDFFPVDLLDHAKGRRVGRRTCE